MLGMRIFQVRFFLGLINRLRPEACQEFHEEHCFYSHVIMSSCLKISPELSLKRGAHAEIETTKKICRIGCLDLDITICNMITA